MLRFWGHKSIAQTVRYTNASLRGFEGLWDKEDRSVTTAELRELASRAATRRDWEEAARLWQAAFDAYPPLPGEFAQHDRANLALRAAECRAMAESKRRHQKEIAAR